MEKNASTGLFEKLNQYAESGYYGFHMPGHKRQADLLEEAVTDPYRIDITEIDGFDDLHHPEEGGILVEAQKRAAKLYHSEETHFLINGSTAGILTAISAALPRGGKILAARNCHRSVFHAIALRGLETVYIYPQIEQKMWINGSILPSEVEKILSENADISAFVLTSPTYDGVVSDLKEIVRICHEHDVIVIVDEAHGAHFAMHESFPDDALILGADLVIQSVHKTMPSLTQTALLQVNGPLIDREKVRFFLSVYQSSSPSYVLMASIDRCIREMEKNGSILYDAFAIRMKTFYEKCSDLKHIALYVPDENDRKTVFAFDYSKVLVSVPTILMTGKEAAEYLLSEHKLQMEMSAEQYFTAICTPYDSEEALGRLAKALHALDMHIGMIAEQKKCGEKSAAGCDVGDISKGNGKECAVKNPNDIEEAVSDDGFVLSKFPRPVAALKIADAIEEKKTEVSFEDAIGRIAATFVYLYPPGLPLITPGEIYSEAVIDAIRAHLSFGMEVHGVTDSGCPVLEINHAEM